MNIAVPMIVRHIIIVMGHYPTNPPLTSPNFIYHVIKLDAHTIVPQQSMAFPLNHNVQYHTWPPHILIVWIHNTSFPTSCTCYHTTCVWMYGMYHTNWIWMDVIPWNISKFSRGTINNIWSHTMTQRNPMVQQSKSFHKSKNAKNRGVKNHVTETVNTSFAYPIKRWRYEHMFERQKQKIWHHVCNQTAWCRIERGIKT